MKTFNITILLAGFVVLFTYGSLQAQPRLKMADSLDFGSVVPPYNNAEKNVVNADVALWNVGDSTLVISSVRVQCGCTIADILKDTIQPGDSTIMKLSVTLFQGNGLLEKYVTVFTNEPHERAHVLNFRVNVQRAIQLGAGFLAFNSTTVGTPTVALLTVFVNQQAGAVIRVEPVTKDLSVLPNEPVTVSANGSVDFIFSYTPSEPGTFSVELLLKTDVPGYEKIELSGYGSAGKN